MIGESFDKSRCCVIMAATRSGFVNTKPLMLRQLTLLKRGCHGGFKQRAQESETLCRKGGTSRSDNAPHASGACAGAKLACGATLSATREFVGLARVLNSLVVAAMITTREVVRLLGARYLLRGRIFRSPIVWQPIYCARTNPGGIFCQNCFRSFGRER